MAPKYRPSTNPDAWWQNAWGGREDISVQYELQFGNEVMKPGTKFKIKNKRGVFKFRCLAHNIVKDITWVDAIDSDTGEWRSFRVDDIKSIVKPKRSRAKKANA